MAINSPYLTTQEAAEVLRFTGKDAKESFLRYAKRKGLTLLRRGRIVLVYKSEVLNSLETAGKRRRATVPQSASGEAIAGRTH